jgi:hypothetical protein
MAVPGCGTVHTVSRKVKQKRLKSASNNGGRTVSLALAAT